MSPSNPSMGGVRNEKTVPLMNPGRAVFEVGSSNAPCPPYAGAHHRACGKTRGETIHFYDPVGLTFAENARELPDHRMIGHYPTPCIAGSSFRSLFARNSMTGATSYA